MPETARRAMEEAGFVDWDWAPAGIVAARAVLAVVAAAARSRVRGEGRCMVAGEFGGGLDGECCLRSVVCMYVCVCVCVCLVEWSGLE